MAGNSRLLTSVVLIVILTVAVFSNTLDNDYHLDSIYRIEQNSEIDRFWPPSRFFRDARTGSSIPQIAEYRPMMPVSTSLNSEIARLVGMERLRAFHIGNILIHTSSAVITFFFFRILLSSYLNGVQPCRSRNPDINLIALTGALIFAIHPISASAVNYLAARDLLLMVLFILSSFLIYSRMRARGDSWVGWLFALILLWFAILSKQAAIMGFGFVFLFEWLLKQKKLRDWALWGRTAIYGIPTAGYFVLRKVLIDQGIANEALRLPFNLSYPITMADAHLFYYLRNFIWPFQMRALAHVDLIESILYPTALIGLLFIIGTLALAWYFKNRQPLVSFGILAYWLFFSLTSSIFPFQYIVTDYRQYLPSVFLSLLVSIAIYSNNKARIAVTASALLLVYFATSTYYINTHWRTEESFWSQSVKYGAVSLAHNNYAMSIVGKDRNLAEFHYNEALKKNPYHIYVNINLALLEISTGRNEQGLDRLRLMAALNSSWALSHYWLSIGLQRSDDLTGSIAPAIRAAELDQRSLKYQLHAAVSMRKAGRHDESIGYLERIVKTNPDYELAEFWLAFAHQKAGNSEEAISVYKKFLERHPDYSQGHFNLGYELMASGDFNAAIGRFEKVLELKPSYKESHYHLAECYRRTGQHEKANFHMSSYNDR